MLRQHKYIRSGWLSLFGDWLIKAQLAFISKERDICMSYVHEVKSPWLYKLFATFILEIHGMFSTKGFFFAPGGKSLTSFRIKCQFILDAWSKFYLHQFKYFFAVNPHVKLLLLFKMKLVCFCKSHFWLSHMKKIFELVNWKQKWMLVWLSLCFCFRISILSYIRQIMFKLAWFFKQK